VHADAHEFVLHLDTDVIAADEFPAVNVPGADGLKMADVRAALSEFVKHKNLLGLVVAQYNPDKDPDGSGARKLVDLLVEALSTRLEAPSASATSAAEPAGTGTSTDTPEVSSPETSA
jgi:arginase family enzyme